MAISFLGRDLTTKEASFQGLSTDPKPTIVSLGTVEYPLVSGSTFLEVDTFKVYIYDSNNFNEILENYWWEVS